MQPGGPPAPPPPPPPPPPPGLPPSIHGLNANRSSRSSKMRNFNWETLPKHSVIGKRNIWTVDKTDGEYELDTDHMEELFSHKQDQQKLKSLNRQTLRGLPITASGGETTQVSILNSKRGMNVGIFLKQFKRPLKDMIEEIQSGNSLGFPSGKLRELCKMLPEEEEERQLLDFKGDHFALPDADQFILMLVKIPSYKERLNGLVLKEEFFPLMGEMKEFIGTLTAAGKELQESDSLHSVIRLVLKAGNYMNAGGYAGCAIGFRMASLLKLVETKANKPGMNLMHYVVMQCQKADKALLKFPEQLTHIEAAARINKDEIEAEFKRQVKKLKAAKADSLKQEDLKAQMEGFFKEAQVCLAETDTALRRLQSASDSVAEYFCEDPSKFKLDECCSVFSCFCAKFTRALQENLAREAAEMQRRHRDRLQCAAKRRSTATCSSRDKGMDGVALESILQNFLTNRVSRRRPGRPSSTYGSLTGRMSESTSQINLHNGNQRIGASLKVMEMGRKPWNSTAELTGSSARQKVQSDREERWVALEEDEKTPRKDDLASLTPPEGTTNISSSDRSFSVTADICKEDLKVNNEEEAQKLREASKKVLRFQNSRGSASSVDYSLENLKSPGPSNLSPRRRTFNEDTEGHPDDPANEDSFRLMFTSQSSSKHHLGHRHTLPTKVPNTKEEEENPSDDSLPTFISAVGDKGTPITECAGHNQSMPGSDFPNMPPDPLKSAAQDDDSPSAERKSEPCYSEMPVPDKGLGERNQEGKSAEPTGNHSRSIENIPPKSTWAKTEGSGRFFNFLKRLGDKLPSSKETVHKGASTGV